MSSKKALFWVIFWIALAFLFDLGIYIFMGKDKAFEFIGGYIIEKSLSLDNLFLFIMIFNNFGLTLQYQARVLNYGIMGAMILRLIFIMLGVAVINTFHWVLYVFGIVLIISGIKMIVEKEEIKDLRDSKILLVLGKIIPISNALDRQKFFTRRGGLIYATPLFAVLVLIEVSDIIFAVDSIPAVFAITTDIFIVYTSNIFAIMGLRSLYFLIVKLHNTFKFVKYGVASILVFTGIKLTILFFNIKISTLSSISVIGAILAISIIFSVALGNNKVYVFRRRVRSRKQLSKY